MKLGIVVNVVGSTSTVGQTTYRLARDATRRGHEVWILASGSFSCEPDGRLLVSALATPRKPASDVATYMRALTKSEERVWLDAADLDVLLLRSNPSVQTPWAQRASLQFGSLAVQRGVLVLNDPAGLERAANKLYLHSLPPEVRPRTLVARRLDRIRAFAQEVGAIVLKPVQGSGGRGVFIVPSAATVNLEAIYRSVARDGYVMAQEYLPAAERGDTRVFLLNGEPLRIGDSWAAVRRVPSGGDLRSNVHVGARIRRAVVDDEIRAVVEAARERLVADGMFFVGLDVVGGKLMEVNVFSPGGLGSAQKFEKVDFCAPVIDALERKLELRGRGLSNREIATAT